MAEEVIKGRHADTLVMNGYSYASVGGTPSTPEQPAEVKMFSEKDIMRRYDLADIREVLDLAGQEPLCFPKPGRSFSGFWTWGGKKYREKLSWHQHRVIEWETKLRALVGKFPKDK